jgi:chaperonin cofactor prefoldin
LLRLSYQQLQHRVENLERRVQTIEQHLGLSA